MQHDLRSPQNTGPVLAQAFSGLLCLLPGLTEAPICASSSTQALHAKQQFRAWPWTALECGSQASSVSYRLTCLSP